MNYFKRRKKILVNLPPALQLSYNIVLVKISHKVNITK